MKKNDRRQIIAVSRETKPSGRDARMAADETSALLWVEVA